MTAKKHTPGPWTCNAGFIVAKFRTDGEVHDVCDPRCAPVYCDKEMDANEYLIAAAPDLLEALKAAEKEIRRLHYLHTPYFEGKIGEPDLRVARQARRAINKAKGKKK